MTSELPRLYTPEEVGKALHKSGWWVRDMARKGLFPCKRVGGRRSILFDAQDIQEIVRGFEERPTADTATPRTTTGRTPTKKATTAATGVTPLRARPPRRARHNNGGDAA